MIECGLLSLAQLRTATAVKLKTNSLMSKSRQTITESGASASCSESVKKVLDTERRFIDDLKDRGVCVGDASMTCKLSISALWNLPRRRRHNHGRKILLAYQLIESRDVCLHD